MQRYIPQSLHTSSTEIKQQVQKKFHCIICRMYIQKAQTLELPGSRNQVEKL